MDKIKTEQPYKLYKKVFKERTSAKRAIIVAILTCVLSMVFDPELGLIIVPLMLIISSPWMFYNPMLKSKYVPGSSYGFFRKVVKTPPMLLNKLDRIQMQNHEDVDFNVKVDLNAIYGVNDKLVMSYQNFGYEKERMEEGDYLLGVSPQGVYFVKKDQTITKTKINFDDIDTLGLLAGLGNVYVFHIISKHNDEINIIVDSNQSLLVSPIMLFNKMLKLLDAFIESGGAVTDSTSRRRRVSVPSSSSSSNGINTGASQESSNNRVIDISYSTGVLEEMRTATYVGSNRNIEIDTPVSTEVVHEEADSSRFVEVEKSEDGSKRNIDLDDIIGSRMADVRKNIVIEDKANPV